MGSLSRTVRVVGSCGLLVGGGLLVLACSPAGSAISAWLGQAPGSLEVELTHSGGQALVGEVSSPPLTGVIFECRLRNGTSGELTDLRAELDCRCSMIDSLPEMLKAGESAVCRFRIVTPEAGRLKRKLTLACKQFGRRPSIFEVAVRAAVSVPVFCDKQDANELRVIEGDLQEKFLVYDTLENRLVDRWIVGAELAAPDALPVRIVKMDEYRVDDEQFVRRRYTVGISPKIASAASGMRTLVWRTKTEGGTESMVRSDVRLTVLPRVAVLPDRISFGGSGASAKDRTVTVVDRLGVETPTLSVPDGGPLTIVRTESGKDFARYRVSPVPESSIPGRIELPVAVADATSRLTVEFAKAGVVKVD
jgi:hypothetical protein